MTEHSINLQAVEQEIIRNREELFLEKDILKYRREHSCSFHDAFTAVREANADSIPDFRPVGDLSVIRWDTGYMVFDMAEAQKLPKKQFNKILALGRKTR